MINAEVKKFLSDSVLCWLASADSKMQPNVSPKEIFFPLNKQHMVIANIASPQSEKNIISNPKVSVSFIDILIQRGYQLKGIAKIVNSNDEDFTELLRKAEELTQGKFPIKNFFVIFVESKKAILAPSYMFYPEIPEAVKIDQAKKAYKL